MIKESGFAHTYFYYPLPDYKLPVIIYSQDVLPSRQDAENVENMRVNYSAGKSTVVADEKSLYADIVENGVFEFFANSFFIEVTK